MGRALTSALGPDTAPVGHLSRVPLAYDSFQAGRQLSRLSGEALVRGRRQPWSLVEKSTAGRDEVSADLGALARRELAVHRSGLLAADGPGLRAARTHAAVEDEDGSVLLLAEDLGRHSPWARATYLEAARDLGRFNGSWLGRVPDEPWLFHRWADRHSQLPALDAGRRVLDRLEPVRTVLGYVDGGEVRLLLDDQTRLAEVLAALPQTLCHHDAVQANLFRVAGRTVAVDWELMGPGPVGADLASLLFSSGRRGNLPVEWLPGLTSAALGAYRSGLVDVGAAVSEEEVRLGFDAAVSLRWSLLRDLVVLASRDGPGRVRGSLPDEPREESIRQLALLGRYLLEAAARVRVART